MVYNIPDQAAEKIKALISNTGITHKLPSQVHFLVEDKTSLRYGGMADITYVGDAFTFEMEVGELGENITPLNVADMLLKHYSALPLLCDEKIAKELGIKPNETNKGLVRRPKGILQVYLPCNAYKVPRDKLPPGTNMQMF